ncbi:nuclear transport factor 2 family protein [Chryseobacterium panacisoli]|uniref:Nuclear transport factor 2 family protein n=1 Tax=Chryseobacterium panacisoli TaxID=1807141 RepID=A0A5D8ZMZ0_9FLAO|nr:nuclear transport factor 2 family protein [Chryseobacterium panacisoli]TZF96319.1 nuclear transport factor 2 family protein [Chryseobacterium panacisoli]
MNLPNILQEFLKAQKLFDSTAFSNCFSNQATVFDEGKIYKGKEEIKHWNEKSNNEFQTLFEVQDFSTREHTILLKINISGSFDGSPALLNFYFRTDDSLITALIITG